MKVAAFFSLTALALAAPTAQPDADADNNVPIAQPRHESITRDDGTLDVESFLASLKGSILKYDNTATFGSVLQGIGSIIGKRGNVALTDVTAGREDELYYGPGSVSGQPFKFIYDTGSSDTFIPGPKCGRAQGCDGNVKYDQSGVNRHKTTTVTYGSGQVKGNDYFDTVTVGGKTAKNQNIISLTMATGFNGTGSDSLMGLGFQSIASSKQTPFFFNLVQQGKCAAQEFGFFLGRKKSGTAGASQMTMCGRDTGRYTGAVTNVPVTQQGYWQVAVEGATVGGSGGGILGGLLSRQLPTTQGQAAMDTGTTVILAPTVAAESIFAQIPGAVPIPQGGVPPTTIYSYPCASKPHVSLQFAGKSFAINPLDFNFGSLTQSAASILAGGDQGLLNSILGGLTGNAGGLCVAGIIATDLNPTENFYVVGDVFLKNWYSIFHYDSPSSAYVGLAKSRA